MKDRVPSGERETVNAGGFSRRQFVRLGTMSTLAASALGQDVVHEAGEPRRSYGERAYFEKAGRYFNPGAYSGTGAARTPLQDLYGIITPSALFFERLHAGVPTTFLVFLFAPCLSWLFAQSAAEHLGRVPTKEEIRRWESPILPDGTGLPIGSGRAVHGEVVFANMCAGCHGGRGEGRDPVGPQLVGGIGSLGTRDPVLTVGSYWPYSTSVWDYIHRAMPYYPNPGTLSVDETYAVTAYILYLNRIITRDQVMNQQTLPRVRMPNRDGFVSDPRPDVHATAKR